VREKTSAHVRSVIAEMHLEGGKRAMQQLMSLSLRPSAVITSNDLMAVGALQAALHAGLGVPTDVSIIGFDDLPVASMVVPQLTSIQLPRREIAARAFSSLLQATRDGIVAKSEVVHPDLSYGIQPGQFAPSDQPTKKSGQLVSRLLFQACG
jgi:DNA-binding LacI/PurR family transcriptional regulator